MYSCYSLYLASEAGTPAEFKSLEGNEENRRSGYGIYRKHGVMPNLPREQKQLPRPKETERNVKQRLELVYTNIMGPISVKSLGNFWDIHKFSDQHVKHIAVYYSETKNDKVRVFKNYHNDLAVINDRKIQRLRTDCGGEYTSEENRAAYKELGVRHETTSPFTPNK